MLAIQLSRQIWQSVSYIQSDSSAFVWKLTTWLHKLMSFPALQRFLTFRTCTETCMWWKSWFHWKGKGWFLWFPWLQKCQNFTQGWGWLSYVTSGVRRKWRWFLKLQKKWNNPPSAWQAPHCMFHQGTCRQLPRAWKANKETSSGVQQWLTSGSAFSWHFWVALPCSAPQKIF